MPTQAPNPGSLTIREPDDWHLHLRDGPMLAQIADLSARQFARAIIMPNLVPPVTTIAAAEAYRDRILAALPKGRSFTPLMTAYLTDTIDADEVGGGFERGVFTACKLYPAGATTNSDSGVTAVRKIAPLLERMQTIGMPLLVHGEVTSPDIDIFDREAKFLETVLSPLLRDFPALKVVLEHITTVDSVQFVQDAGPTLAATITPHHLRIDRNALFAGGLRPHAYCLPVAKRRHHRTALRQAAVSGNPKFFLGTDSAPHLKHDKESACGCAGIFAAVQAHKRLNSIDVALGREPRPGETCAVLSGQCEGARRRVLGGLSQLAKQAQLIDEGSRRRRFFRPVRLRATAWRTCLRARLARTSLSRSHGW